MANPEHVELVKRGAQAIKVRRKKAPDERLDLSGADLFRADLFGADLNWADLSFANLREANLREANLRMAYLSRAYLSRACLRRACLREAYLTGADLTGADLTGADLTGAYVNEADLMDTVFADVDLRNVEGLSDVTHHGPSPVSTSTLARLQGEITPDTATFLQGCGLQPWEIEQARMYDPALTPAQIAELQIEVFEKRTVGPLFLGGAFISYSRADSDFVDRVYKRLKSEGMPVWLDRHDLVAGDLQEQVARAIRLNDIVLIVLSKTSTTSDWVENELDMARHKEKTEGRKVLCPIALDDSWKSRLDNSASDRALWRTLTKKVILDFSDPAQFETQFQKLLRGLKVNYEKKPGEQE